MHRAKQFNINLIGEELQIRARIDEHLRDGDFVIPIGEHVWAVGGTSVRARIAFARDCTITEVKKLLREKGDRVFHIGSISFACMGSKCL